METKEYFEKIMQDYNQHRKGCNLRKYCTDEGIDYKCLVEYKKIMELAIHPARLIPLPVPRLFLFRLLKSVVSVLPALLPLRVVGISDRLSCLPPVGMI